MPELLQALGGLGLVLYSVRQLTAALNRYLGRRLKPLLAQVLSNPQAAMLFGCLAASTVRASNLVLLTCMGLVDTSLLTLEQGYYACLGSGVGATLALWLGSLASLPCAAVLVGVCSVAMIVARRAALRQGLEVLATIGLIFLGLHMITQGTESLFRDLLTRAWVTSINGTSLMAELQGMLAGALLGLLVDSSAVLVFTVTALVAQQHLSLEGGASLILGGNLGLAFLPWLASLEQEAKVRRLALSQVLVKVGGLLLLLLPYNYFLTAVRAVVHLLRLPTGAELACVHTGFNLLVLVVFGWSGELVLKWVRRLIPEQEFQTNIALPMVVRRMLSYNPGRALFEARRQGKKLDTQTKAAIDACFVVLVEAKTSSLTRSEEARQRREFEALRDSCCDLLLRLSRQRLTHLQRQHIEGSMRLLGRFEDLHAQAIGLFSTLVSGVIEQGLVLPKSLCVPIAEFQSAFDALWLRVHFHQAHEPELVSNLVEASEHLDEFYFSTLLDQAQVSADQASWIYELVSRLGRLSDTLILLAGLPEVRISMVDEEEAQVLEDSGETRMGTSPEGA